MLGTTVGGLVKCLILLALPSGGRETSSNNNLDGILGNQPVIDRQRELNSTPKLEVPNVRTSDPQMRWAAVLADSSPEIASLGSKQQPNHNSTERVQQVLKLAEHGIAVFPCKPDKRPYTASGFKNASTEPDTIKKWWQLWPDALIGVPTGEKFVVVDCDLQHPEAQGWYFDHAVRLTTRKHSTKSGGCHLLFKPDGRVRCSAGKIHAHIDTRGKGGYIIWWPAEGLDVLHGGTLAEVPDFIIEGLNPPEPEYVRQGPITVQAACRGIEGIIRTIAMAAPGERNTKLFWGASRLKEKAEQSILSRSDAIGLALEAANRAGLSPLEARRTVASAFRGQ
jgi:hypothetical protein